MPKWSDLSDKQKEKFGSASAFRDARSNAPKGSNLAGIKKAHTGTNGNNRNNNVQGPKPQNLADLFPAPPGAGPLPDTPIVGPVQPSPSPSPAPTPSPSPAPTPTPTPTPTPEVPYEDPSAAPWQDQFEHEEGLQSAELAMMMALQKDQQAHAERMNAKDRAASYMDANANKQSGKWNADFTGGASQMGQRTFAERARGEIHKTYKFD